MTAVSEKSSLARRVRQLRSGADLTLQDLSRRSGIATSTLSKIENAQLSPTYDNIVRLAAGFGIDIARLFRDEQESRLTARRSVTRRGEGVGHKTPNYDYEMLCTDLAKRKMVPLFARIKAHTARDFGPLISHDGEELIYVLSGAVVLHTEHYAPIVLHAGDCAYFDSTMGHACIAQSLEDAEVFWVCSNQEAVEEAFNGRPSA